MKSYKFLLTLISILLIISACYEPKQYPPEPQIDYQRTVVLNAIDELGNQVRQIKIFFDVLDGDGNIGEEDGSAIKNLFIKFYEKENGEFYEYEFEIDVPMEYSIPFVSPIGLNDYYKAEICVDLTFPIDFFDPEIVGDIAIDTIKFDFYIEDQAINKSNLQETHEIPHEFAGNLIDTVTVIYYD